MLNKLVHTIPNIPPIRNYRTITAKRCHILPNGRAAQMGRHTCDPCHMCGRTRGKMYVCAHGNSNRWCCRWSPTRYTYISGDYRARMSACAFGLRAAPFAAPALVMNPPRAGATAIARDYVALMIYGALMAMYVQEQCMLIFGGRPAAWQCNGSKWLNKKNGSIERERIITPSRRAREYRNKISWIFCFFEWT